MLRTITTITTITTIAEARREGFDVFMFTNPVTAQTDRTAFITQHPGGVEFTDEYHSRGDVFKVYCYALKHRAGQHSFVRASDMTDSEVEIAEDASDASIDWEHEELHWLYNRTTS